MSLTIFNSNNIYHKEDIGIVRTAQEDSHDVAAMTPNGDVFVVCDGMGGHVGGKQASSTAVKCIIEYLKRERYPDPMKALDDALQFANMQILGYANEHPELKGMGTTACIVLLQDSEAYIAHVGDSRIYLYLGKEKALHRITKDHSYVQNLVDLGQITEEEAEHHPHKNRILKALGIKPDLSPTINIVRPKNGDVFLICSDGLCGMISDSIITDILSDGNTTIEEKGDMLIHSALAAGGTDNITVELITIANSPHSKSIFHSYNAEKAMSKNAERAVSKNNAEKEIIKSKRNLLPLIITLCIILLCGAVGSLLYIYTRTPQKEQSSTVVTKADKKQSGTDVDHKQKDEQKGPDNNQQKTFDAPEQESNNNGNGEADDGKKEHSSYLEYFESMTNQKREDLERVEKEIDKLKNDLTKNPTNKNIYNERINKLETKKENLEKERRFAIDMHGHINCVNISIENNKEVQK